MENEVWTIKAALDWTCGYLARKGDANPRLSAEWLLAEACNMRRIELYVNFERPLSLAEREVLRDYVSRRGKGEPLQYITGEVAFRHIAVKVRSGVLIPRPETEVLVSEALSLLPLQKRACIDEIVSRETISTDENSALNEQTKNALQIVSRETILHPGVSEIEKNLAVSQQNVSRETIDDKKELDTFLVADICTGSGCIACSIAYERPDTHVFATDISSVACELARENCEALSLDERLEVFEGDLGECLPAEIVGALDLVVSNPPYVPSAVLSEIPREVSDFEPSLALDGGADGLVIYRRLLDWSTRALKPGGGLAVELHETRLDEAATLAMDAGFENVRIVKDLAGRPRVLTARLSL